MPATTPRGAPETNGNAGGESGIATCCTNSSSHPMCARAWGGWGSLRFDIHRSTEKLDSEDFGRAVVPHGLASPACVLE